MGAAQSLVAPPGRPPLGYSGPTMKLDPAHQSEPDTREQFKIAAQVRAPTEQPIVRGPSLAERWSGSARARW
eukprot:scaffold664_cov232-Prasinococcus_capsulatus_cf.AAC.1